MARDARHKQIHINLYDDHVEDYEVVRQATGIMNDNDLVRYLFRQAAISARRQLALPMQARAEA